MFVKLPEASLLTHFYRIFIRNNMRKKRIQLVIIVTIILVKFKLSSIQSDTNATVTVNTYVICIIKLCVEQLYRSVMDKIRL